MLEPSYPFDQSPDQLECLRILGQSYYAQKNIELCLRTFQRWIDVGQRIHSVDQPYLGLDRTILAGLCAHHGQMAKAEQLYLPIVEKMDRQSKEYFATEMKLFRLYEVSKEFDKAESVLKSLLRESEQLRGDLAPGTADVRYGLARVLVKQNRDQEAEALYKQLVRKYESASATSDDLANCLTHLAYFYQLSKNPSEEEKQLQRALCIRKAINNESLIGTSLEHLQQFYVRTRQQSKILSLFAETSPEVDMRETPSFWKKRAVIFARVGNLEAAEKELSKLVSSLESDKSTESLKFKNAIYALGQLYVLDNKLSAAEPLHERAYNTSQADKVTYCFVSGSAAEPWLKLNSDIFGTQRDHDRYPKSCHFIAALYALEHKFAEAESIYKTELNGPLRSNIPEYKVISYYNALAWVLLQEGKFEESIQALSDAIAVANKKDSYLEAESVLLNGNMALVFERAGKDPLSVLSQSLHAIQTNRRYASDPVPDFGVEDGGEYSDQYYGSYFSPPDEYLNSDGLSRIEPTFDYSSPPLVLFTNGDLGVKDFSLFPGEVSRADYFEFDKNPQMEFLDWIFAFWNRGEERLEALARVRSGDVCTNTNRLDEAVKQYDQAITIAERDDDNKSVVAVAYEHKATLLRQTGKSDEANRCDDYARTYRKEAEQQLLARHSYLSAHAQNSTDS
jgi:tetratricopeptide (TPR) repeat protein